MSSKRNIGPQPPQVGKVKRGISPDNHDLDVDLDLDLDAVIDAVVVAVVFAYPRLSSTDTTAFTTTSRSTREVRPLLATLA